MGNWTAVTFFLLLRAIQIRAIQLMVWPNFSIADMYMYMYQWRVQGGFHGFHETTVYTKKFAVYVFFLVVSFAKIKALQILFCIYGAYK